MLMSLCNDVEDSRNDQVCGEGLARVIVHLIWFFKKQQLDFVLVKRDTCRHIGRLAKEELHPVCGKMDITRHIQSSFKDYK